MNNDLNRQFNKALTMNHTTDVKKSSSNGNMNSNNNLDVIHIQSNSRRQPVMKTKSTQTESIPIVNTRQNESNKFHVGNPEAVKAKSSNDNNNTNNNAETLKIPKNIYNTESDNSFSVVIPKLQIPKSLKTTFNYIGQLQELVAKNQNIFQVPNYKMLTRKSDGFFVMECQVKTLIPIGNDPDNTCGFITTGSASTKKDAKHIAASKMIFDIEKSDLYNYVNGK